MPKFKIGQRVKAYCGECREPTTHIFDRRPDETGPRLICLMHEGDRPKSKEQIARMRQTRKGWRERQ